MHTSMIKAVAFDVDGTLIDSHVWEELHVLFGLSREENMRLHSQYVQGALTFHEVTDLMAGMYSKKMPRVTRAQADVVFKNFRLLPGAEEVVRTVSQKYPVALISSGLTDYVRVVAESLGIEHVYSYTRFSYSENGEYTGISYNSPTNELEAKVSALKDFGAQVGLEAHEILFVGDSINDRAAFEHTGRGVLVGEGTPELREAAWKQVNTISDLIGIL